MEEKLKLLKKQIKELRKLSKNLNPHKWQYASVISDIYELEDKIEDLQDHIREEKEST